MVRVRAWLGLGLVLAFQASYAIMLQVYDDYYVLTAIYHIDSFSYHALSPCISAWTIPTYPFIYFGNIDLSTCRLAFKFPVDMLLYIYICQLSAEIDLSTCRSVDLSTCRLVDLSTCRPVDLSTCRASAIVYNKDPIRVRVSVLLGLGLG